MMRDKTVREIVDAAARYFYIKGFEEGYSTEFDPEEGQQGAYLRGFKEGYTRGCKDNGVRKNRKHKKHDSRFKRVR